MICKITAPSNPNLLIPRDETPSELYERALTTAIDSIKSILDDDAIRAWIEHGSIIVDLSGSNLRYTLKEFKAAVLPAFVDKSGNLYENFVPTIDVTEI